MKKKFSLSILISILLFTFILIEIGCSKRKRVEEIKVGVILPLTGPIAMGGKRVLNGIQLAVSEFNSTSKTQIILEVEDSKGEPAVGVNAINRLIKLRKVNLVIGDLTSGVTLSIAPIAEKNKIILFAPGASNPSVREAGDYIFRNWISDDFDGMVAASYLINKLKKKKVIVLYIQNDYGVGLKDAFINQFNKVGGKIVFNEGFIQGQNDFRTLLSKIKQKDFDSVYIAGQPREMGYLIRQMKEFAINSTVFSNVSVEEKDFQTIAGNASTGIYYTSPGFDLTKPDDVVSNFVASYREKFREEPDIASAHGYDTAKMLLQCIKEKGSNTDNVKFCLYSIENFKGITGTTSIDEYGDAIKGLLVKKFSEMNNEIQTLEYYKPTIKSQL